MNKKILFLILYIYRFIIIKLINYNNYEYYKACYAKCDTCNNSTGDCVTCADSTHRLTPAACNCSGNFFGLDTDAVCTGKSFKLTFIDYNKRNIFLILKF